MEAMREDLESTKQLLDLELRSKKLLEKDNKRLAQELEKLKMEMAKGGGSGAGGAGSGNTAGSEPSKDETEKKASRRNSVATKRHSVIRLLSESESHENIAQDADGISGAETGNGNSNNNEVLDENDEDNAPLTPGYDAKTDFWGTVAAAKAKADDSVAAAARAAVADINTFTKPAESFYEEEIAELDEMRDEVDEARELAAEWEAKYKEMQRYYSYITYMHFYSTKLNLTSKFFTKTG
jgi:cell division septum initiation protein DivIVA